ncbi:Gfo/Idh/MocA family protein [Provencibacterium massiliense]|uniref:Gfo/Idh/MocA family protein n=1 Tax=Provencibacterium massiliense TaxID=1841868 RepID=UPI0009A84D50|nr:Gfo/Idh/MocA family oxidoreductase [Provencibacterium massiliense]
MKKLKACIAGMGFVGAVHAEALHRTGAAELIAVADPAKAAQKAEKCGAPRGYDDALEMIERERPDVLHICTPNRSHYELARFALEKGIHVLCEKPLCSSSDQARQLCELAEERRLRCGLNLSFRYNPQIMQMRSLISQGKLGRLFSVHGSYLQDWLLYDTDYSWRLETDFPGETRAVADIGSHWMDLCQFVSGQKITAVMAEFSTFHRQRKKPLHGSETFCAANGAAREWQEVPVGTEDCALLMFRFESGLVGSCTLSQAFAGRKNQLLLSVAGSESSLCWDSDCGNRLWWGRRDGYNQEIEKAPELLEEPARRVTGYPGGHAEGFADTFKQGFLDFYGSLTKDANAAGCYAGLEDGLRLLQLCESAALSAREHRWVELP